MIKILIADDHTIVREGIKQILADTADLVVAGEATNGHEVLEQIRKEDWDVVVLDLAMPGKDGLDTLKELKIEKPKLPVLVLSMHPEEQYAVRLLKAGASGYLTKESAPEELIAAIRKVSQKGKYVSSSLGEKLAFYLESESEKPVHEVLSDREYRVMLMIASGKTVKEIGEEMFLSIKTISTYRVRALKKMGMKNNAAFTYYAVKHNLLK
ncbi:MAG: response regulator transcription factor [Syntrophobacterales bacterium]|jgi:DNA-binding NarL/FixJ family response regulator|nr:response regulator transcription factor [Syntrophobacterales bacterium]